jgi:hypothetical protein
MIDFRSNNRRIDEIEGSCKRERFEGSSFWEASAALFLSFILIRFVHFWIDMI